MNFRNASMTLIVVAGIAIASGSWQSCAMAVDHRVRLSVVDSQFGHPLPARIYLTSDRGDAYYFSSEAAEGSAVRYEKQHRVNKRSTEYHTTVSAHPCSAVVPEGNYTLVVEHGKSYRVAKQNLAVDRDWDLKISLQRWCDPNGLGWYSGDTHLHRSLAELRNVVLAEDINVALPLTSWVTYSGKPPASGDKNISDVHLSTLVTLDERHVIWPRNTEYEIFTVSQQRHTLGALFVLGHRDPLQWTVPTWKPVIDQLESTEPDVLFDMDKLDWPFAMLLPTIAPHALYELANNHMWRTEFAFRDWNTPAPPYLQPPFGGKAGGHRQWIDYTHGMYHTLLNCGLRLPPSAGTANGVHPVPAGFGRVYVHLPEGFSYDAFMRGLKLGRSFVTTGPMLYATANGQDPGYVFHIQDKAQDAIQLDMEVQADSPLLYGEVLINGRPEHLLSVQNKPNGLGALQTKLTQAIRLTRSGWFAVRFWQTQPDGQVRFCHTAPWYVDVDGQPVKVARVEKQYLVDRMRNEMVRSQGVVSSDAMQEYRKALEFYQALPEWDDAGEVAVSSRQASTQPDLDRWLDNMIIDHRFTADEIRSATGLSEEQAEAAIGKRLAAVERASGLRLRPYPGGRHPRRGFLDGAIDPQRETKLSVFPPWKDGGYVVVDVPEAVFSNLGLTYLAHKHIPTIWDKQSIQLPKQEWQEHDSQFSLVRSLPNGIVLSSYATPTNDGVALRLELTNGTERPLTGLRVQVCTMLKGAVGFNLQEPLETIQQGAFIAVKSNEADRWIVTRWSPNHRVWANPPVPCIHSDPVFPDCQPNETVAVSGQIWFYVGTDVRSLMQSD